MGSIWAYERKNGILDRFYDIETGETLELNGVQEISIADEVIAENLQKAVLDFDREIAGSFEVTDQMSLLRLKLMCKSWAGLVPRVRIRKAFWPWKGAAK